MTDRNIKSFLNHRAHFQTLLQRPRTPRAVANLNRVRDRLETLAQRIHGNASLKYTPNVDTRTMKFARDLLFLNGLRAEEGEIVNNNWMTSYAQNTYHTKNLYKARDAILSKMHGPARKIQQAFRKSRLTNKRFRNLFEGSRLTNTQLQRMQSFVNRRGGNYNEVHKSIVSKRNASPRAGRAARTIQSAFKKHKRTVIDVRRAFILSLSEDGRFDYYVEVLARLDRNIAKVLNMIRQGAGNAVTVITNAIGVCHYNPRPARVVQNASNVRKNLVLMKKRTPREYLNGLRKQLDFVATEYARMSEAHKKKYLDRLNGELSDRPCLENLIESLVKALFNPEFVWLGKTKKFQNTPLVPGNARYLGPRGLVNTALTSWAISSNRPKNWNSMNLENRKVMFWKMIRNLPVAMVHGNMVVNGTPRLYNRGGVTFKKSALANTLEYA